MRLKDWFYLTIILYAWASICLVSAVLAGPDPRLLMLALLLYLSPVYLFTGAWIFRRLAMKEAR